MARLNVPVSFITKNPNPNLWKGTVAGCMGGLAGSWMMLMFQSAWSRALHGRISGNLRKNVPEHRVKPRAEFSLDSIKRLKELRRQEDDATLKVASAISRKIAQRALNHKERNLAGAAIHYLLGAAAGGLYGAVSEFWPVARTGQGVPFGAAVAVVADGIAVPTLGFSRPPHKVPASNMAYGLATHGVYGLTTELVRCTVRKFL